MGWGSSTWRDGGQKVRYVPRNQGNQTFLVGYPGILPQYPSGARKVWENKFVFNFRSLLGAVREFRGCTRQSGSQSYCGRVHFYDFSASVLRGILEWQGARLQSLRIGESESVSAVYPDHLFPGVPVKAKENHPKHQGFLDPSDPQKTFKNQRKTEQNQNTKDFPWLERSKRKIRTPRKRRSRQSIGDGPKTVSESMVSTPSSVLLLALTEFRGESSVSPSRPIIFFFVPKRTHRVFRRTHRACRRT